jgi:hypothetical protein
MRVLITVKAAPNPSAKYGETVCVAGLRIDLDHLGWVRLYPLNYRWLDSDVKFKKYAVLELSAKPARGDGRRESWRPDWESVATVREMLPPWKPRRRWIDEHREGSMCRLNAEAKADPRAKSLALITPAEILDFEISDHPGWDEKQQHRLDQYLLQDELPFGDAGRRPPQLEAPKYKGHYRYRCQDSGCRGHRQQVLDWEFVALQRRLDREGADMKAGLREKFLDELCAPRRDTAFYVGNMAARPHIFSTLGVYWPPR